MSKISVIADQTGAEFTVMKSDYVMSVWQLLIQLREATFISEDGKLF
jgi:hypothetical protein